MHLLPSGKNLPVSANALSGAPLNFFQALRAAYYADPAFDAQCPTLMVIPRFRKGGFLMLRVAQSTEQLFSLEFPCYQPGVTAKAHEKALSGAFDGSALEFNTQTIQRIGRIPGKTLKSTVDIYVVLIPESTLVYNIDAIDAPLRVTERSFHEYVERAEISDFNTLAAYTFLISRQSLLKDGMVSPLLDRRKSSVRIKPAIK